AGLVGTLGFISAFPAVYALSSEPETPRVINTVFMVWTLGWLAAVLLGANEFLRWRSVDRNMVWTVAALLLVLSVAASGNFQDSLRELRSLPQFNWEMKQRHLALAHVGSHDHVLLKRLSAPHRFLLVRDISSIDVTDWRNACYAAYLGVA